MVWSLLEAPWRFFGGLFQAPIPCFPNQIRQLLSRGCLEGSSSPGWELSGGDPWDFLWLEIAGLSFAAGWEPSDVTLGCRFRTLRHFGSLFLSILLGSSCGPDWETLGKPFSRPLLTYSSADLGFRRVKQVIRKLPSRGRLEGSSVPGWRPLSAQGRWVVICPWVGALWSYVSMPTCRHLSSRVGRPVVETRVVLLHSASSQHVSGYFV